MDYLPLIAFAVIIILFIGYAGRARRKQQAVQTAMVERIGVGTEVMTTSGLYGTVVAKNPDDTVQLSIAAGVEVKWELAALRDVASLPEQFKGRPAQQPVELQKDETGNRDDAR